MKSDNPQPIFVPPHSGKKLEFRAVTHKLTGQQTGGAYYLFETVFGPGNGNRLHIHRREDEVGYVLEGALEIRLADQTVIVEAGSVAHLPKNVPHAIRNPLEGAPRSTCSWQSPPDSTNGSMRSRPHSGMAHWTIPCTANCRWIMALNGWSSR